MRTNPMIPALLLFQAVLPASCGASGDSGQADGSGGSTDVSWGASIEILSPSEGAVVNWPSVEVTGVVHGAPCDVIELNDVAVPWTPPSFSAPVRLEQEGPNVISVRCGEAVATVTVVLDSLPPYLVLVTPNGGTVLPDLGPGDSLQVAGFAQDEAGVTVSVLGNPAGPGREPDSFLASWPLSVGLNLVHVEALDQNGNRSREHRPVLAGPFGNCAPTPGRPDVIVRLSDGAIGLAASRAAEALLDTDFTPLLAEYNPVYESEQLRLDLHALVIEPPAELETTAVTGSFAAELFVGAIQAEGTLTFKASQTEWSFQARIDALTATASVIPSVESGTLALQVTQVVVDAGEVQVAVQDDTGKDVVAPTEISGNFLEFFTDLLSEVLQDTADQAASSAASFVQGDVAFDFLGVEVEAGYSPESLDVGGHQVTIGYLVDLKFPGDKAVPWPHGCPMLGGTPPLPPPPVDLQTAAFGLSLSQDFVNRTLTGLWTAGNLFVTIDQAMLDAAKIEVDLVCGLGGTLLDLVSDPPLAEWPLSIQVTPALPPLLQPTKYGGSQGTDGNGEGGQDSLGEHAVGIAFGGIQLDLYAKEPTGTSRLFSSVELSLVLGLEAVVGNSDLEFFLSLSDFFLELDQSMSPLQEREAERDIESFFESLVPEIANTLASSLIRYHLPLFYGVQVVEGQVEFSPEGYIVVQGRVVDKGGAQ